MNWGWFKVLLGVSKLNRRAEAYEKTIDNAEE